MKSCEATNPKGQRSFGDSIGNWLALSRNAQATPPRPSCKPDAERFPVPMTPHDAVPVSLLRHRPFVLYWVARVFAAFAFQMVGVAVGWQIYALTGNAFDLGLV